MKDEGSREGERRDWAQGMRILERNWTENSLRTRLLRISATCDRQRGLALGLSGTIPRLGSSDMKPTKRGGIFRCVSSSREPPIRCRR